MSSRGGRYLAEWQRAQGAQGSSSRATPASTATRTGAYDPDATGNNVIRTTLTTSPIACCGTGNQSHIGTFRVRPVQPHGLEGSIPSPLRC